MTETPINLKILDGGVSSIFEIKTGSKFLWVGLSKFVVIVVSTGEIRNCQIVPFFNEN